MALKNEIMFHVQNKTKNLKQNEKTEKTNPTLQRDDAMKYLEKSKQDL